MSNIIRDTDAMERFAFIIEEYDDEIENICNKLESAIYAAENGLNDEQTRKAAQKLYDLVLEVKSVTNPMSDVGESISKGAKVLRRADEIFGG